MTDGFLLYCVISGSRLKSILKNATILLQKSVLTLTSSVSLDIEFPSESVVAHLILKVHFPMCSHLYRHFCISGLTEIGSVPYCI